MPMRNRTNSCLFIATYDELTISVPVTAPVPDSEPVVACSGALAENHSRTNSIASGSANDNNNIDEYSKCLDPIECRSIDDSKLDGTPAIIGRKQRNPENTEINS